MLFSIPVLRNTWRDLFKTTMHIFLFMQVLRWASAQHGYMPEVQWVWRGFWPLSGSSVEKDTRWLTSQSKAAWSTSMKTSQSPKGASVRCAAKESSTGVKITHGYGVFFPPRFFFFSWYNFSLCCFIPSSETTRYMQDILSDRNHLSWQWSSLFYELDS